MAGCGCETSGEDLAKLRGSQGRVLWIVLTVNFAMFLVEGGAGWLAHSTALLGDSLDMLGDALVYGFSLWVLHRGATWRARAALSKGLIQLAFGVGVCLQAVRMWLSGLVPAPEAMAGIGLLALLANSGCFVLLWRHRGDDLNMRSTWLCSRNDLVANASVLVAAAMVGLFHAAWPDVLVGLGIAALFLRTAALVIRSSLRELAGPAPAGTPPSESFEFRSLSSPPPGVSGRDTLTSGRDGP